MNGQKGDVRPRMTRRVKGRAPTMMALERLLVLYHHNFLVHIALRPSLGILLLVLSSPPGRPVAMGDAHHRGSAPAADRLAVLTAGPVRQSEIDSDDKLPCVTARLLRRHQVLRVREVLTARGRGLWARLPSIPLVCWPRRQGVRDEVGPVPPGRWAGLRRRGAGHRTRLWPGPGAKAIGPVAGRHWRGRADGAVSLADLVCPARARRALLTSAGSGLSGRNWDARNSWHSPVCSGVGKTRQPG